MQSGIKTRIIALLLFVSLQGCSSAFMEGFAEGLANSSAVASYSGKLMIFGGPGHDTYLGCLSCSSYSSDSVFNQYGQFGNQYRTQSIYSNYSQFGSRYSTYSACSRYASDPPVVVDEAGNFYGRLTVNRYHAQAIKDPNILAWLEQEVCG